MTVFLVYLFIGILLAFATWIARQNDRLDTFEVIALIVIWPYFFLYTFFLSDIKLVIKQSIDNKLLFVKVYFALLALAGIAMFAVDKMGR